MIRLSRHRPLRLAAGALALLLVGAGPCTPRPITIGLPTPAGLLPVQVELPPAADPALATVALDGGDVSAAFAPGGPGLLGSLPLPAAGSHRLDVTAPRHASDPVPFRLSLGFASPAPVPALVSVFPNAGAVNVPRTWWLRFVFATPPAPEALTGWGFALECNGQRRGRTAHVLASGAVILNPAPELPAGSSCRVLWRNAGGGLTQHAFSVAANVGTPGEVHYDRANALRVTPFPDDYWTVADGSTATGLRVEPEVPPFSDPLQQEVYAALISGIGPSDGWSRQSPIVVSLAQELDVSSLRIAEAEAGDPFAPVALIDIDPASPDSGRRIPFRLIRRSDSAPSSAGGGTDRVWMVFPSIDLRENGQYAFVVTRRIYRQALPGAPFAPSAFFAPLLSPALPFESPERARARASIEPALVALATLPEVPIPSEDVALAFRLTIRTQPGPSDLVAVKELALASPPPALVLPDPAVNPCPNVNNSCIRLSATRALEVRGHVELPDFRDSVLQIARDAAGRPVPTHTNLVPFALSLPLPALDGPVRPVMYQHGNPGSAPDLFIYEGELDDAGFAVLGITDTLNREFGQDQDVQTQGIFFALLLGRALPASWFQTTADQIFFLRAIQGMGGLDLLRRDAGGAPAIGADGIPEIDPSAIFYKGISEGANNAERFLPFAPELVAAEATVGGTRLAETLIHQSASDLLFGFRQTLPALRPVELWVGLSLFQAALDPQDGHTFLRHLYRAPLLPFAGSSDVTPTSTIWTEGVGDTYVPNNASRAMAIELGIPHVRPVAVSVPGLPQVDAPLSGNVAPGVTAGYFQFNPATTPWCVQEGESEGHFCAQGASEALAQRLHFFLTALGGSAEIVDPF